MYYPKDFIETAEGLKFAVVAQGLERDKVLCFLRYALDGKRWYKCPTAKANELLETYYPDYLHFSGMMDAHLHAVPIRRIIRHHQPRQKLRQILLAGQRDAVEQDLFQLCMLFQQNGLDLTQTGVTGSLLVSTHQQDSDIDLVCYTREAFQQCRERVRALIDDGSLQNLHEDDWLESYARRSCELSYAEYAWHERRKFNKALINGRKFDLTFIDPVAGAKPLRYQKLNAIALRCKVLDDTFAFDYPARFKIAHAQISDVVCFTATYTGQALSGETIEVSGFLEQSELGDLRIVVGATREAQGEYIKVLQS